jgi:GNAT superfamily N-acetyltransferase
VSRANVRVRPVDLSDVPGLVALTTSFDLSAGVFSGRPMHDPSERHIGERLTEIIEDRSRTMLVAVDDSADSAGIVALLVARNDEIGAIDLTPVLHITHLLVDARFRRRGVGRQLLTAAVHLADERGVDHVLATAASGHWASRTHPSAWPSCAAPVWFGAAGAPERRARHGPPEGPDGRGIRPPGCPTRALDSAA